jgi:predicted dinucleotide-binding enzyme
MKIAVLGTGMVGHTMGTKLVALGHEVTMGSRSATSEKGLAWTQSVKSDKASLATFADAARGAELIMNCTAGVASLDALRAAGSENLAGKILVDLSNPLDFSQGMPPRLSVCNDESLGEQIQKEFPQARVVKTLNTMSHTIMVNPQKLSGDHVVFVAGESPEAKSFVKETLLQEWFGWTTVLDLGGIQAARGTETYLPLWLKIWGALGTAEFNLTFSKEA